MAAANVGGDFWFYGAFVGFLDSAQCPPIFPASAISEIRSVTHFLDLDDTAAYITANARDFAISSELV